jgi:hypothetical protein
LTALAILLSCLQPLTDYDNGQGQGRRVRCRSRAIKLALLKRFNKNGDGVLDDEEKADARKAFGR